MNQALSLRRVPMGLNFQNPCVNRQHSECQCMLPSDVCQKNVPQVGGVKLGKQPN